MGWFHRNILPKSFRLGDTIWVNMCKATDFRTETVKICVTGDGGEPEPLAVSLRVEYYSRTHAEYYATKHRDNGVIGDAHPLTITIRDEVPVLADTKWRSLYPYRSSRATTLLVDRLGGALIEYLEKLDRARER